MRAKANENSKLGGGNLAGKLPLFLLLWVVGDKNAPSLAADDALVTLAAADEIEK